jgi:hypothetical protein
MLTIIKRLMAMGIVSKKEIVATLGLRDNKVAQRLRDAAIGRSPSRREARS